MIEYIKGNVDELTPAYVVVEAHGVGYGLAISLNTYTSLQNKHEAKLYVYEAIREDAYQLFGFSTKQERECFLHLIGVSGVGGQTARMILSAFTSSELENIVRNEDVRSLKTVKGVGPKAAQRIIIDLKDKLQLTSSSDGDMLSGTAQSNVTVSRECVNEAVAALNMLGFAPAAAHKVVTQIFKENPHYQVEQLIKEALKRI